MTTSTSAKQEQDRPAESAQARPQQQEISFVSFQGSTSSENRKAVRVQAAKASAAARKATIAKKLAAQEKKDKVVEEVDFASTPAQPRKRKAVKQFERSPGSVLVDHEVEEVDRAVAIRRRVRDGELPNIPTPPHSPVSLAEDAQSLPRKRKRSVVEYTRSRRGIGSKQGQSLSRGPAGSAQAPEPVSLIARSLGSATGARYSHITPFANTMSAQEICMATAPPPAALAHDLPPTPLTTPGLHDSTGASLTRAEPFNAYPIEYNPIYDRLLHHMLTVFAPRGWPALKISHAQGLSWEAWMTQHALAEPALFLVRLLFASGDMIRLGILDPAVSLWLQNRAVQAINEALQSPSRACSDGLILAVGRIALHESMYGDRAAANAMHRPAQRRMIDMRGGMRGLGFPKLITRLMRWSDRVMAMQGGNARLLPDDEEDDDDGDNAGGAVKGGVRQDVQVLEQWVPNEGKALRRRIEIRDLLE